MFNFLLRRNASEPVPGRFYHNPSDLPSHPILRTSATAPQKSLSVHWWDSNTEYVTADAIPFPRHRHRPSNASPPSGVALLPHLPSPKLPSSGILEDVSASQPSAVRKGQRNTARPVQRVRTLPRRVGRAIQKCRQIETRWPREKMMKGLTLVFNPHGPALKPICFDEVMMEARADMTYYRMLARSLEAHPVGREELFALLAERPH